MSLLPCITFDTGPNPTASVIWLHGLGADGNDFAPIASQLELGDCPPIRFIFPHAPVMPVTINGGYQMRAWYDIAEVDLVRREDAPGIRQSQAQIEALIAHENKRGVASNRILLAGFSQGCAMALYTGLRHPEALAGLLCLSGYLPLADTLAAERHPANQSTPIFLAHGEFDHVVPMARASASRDLLIKLGYDIDWHSYPMDHSVAEEEIDHIAAFVRHYLS
jgi:phospholipase/carboxylesterase